MKLGIGTYCTMWAIGFKFGETEARPVAPMSAMGLLERARDLGVHLVQYGPNLSLSALSDAELERLLACAREWDIELEVGTRGLDTDPLGRQLLLCNKVGSKILRTIPEIGGQPMEAADIPHYLNAILPMLEETGVKLGLENGKIPCRDLAHAINQVPSPYVGVVLDMVNSMAVPEGWREVTQVLAPYTICLHHKEFVVKRVWHMMGFSVLGSPAGTGQLDTPWVLEQLDNAGATYNVILEVWPPEQATLEQTIALEDQWVRESLPYLRQFVPN